MKRIFTLLSAIALAAFVVKESIAYCVQPQLGTCATATTGKVRQLLCGNCNRGIGLFFDNPEYLRMAADYLEFHKKEHENG